LAGLEDCLFIRHFVPRALVHLAFEETAIQSLGGSDNLVRDSSFSGVTGCIKLWLAFEAEITKGAITGIQVDSSACDG